MIYNRDDKDEKHSASTEVSQSRMYESNWSDLHNIATTPIDSEYGDWNNLPSINYDKFKGRHKYIYQMMLQTETPAQMATICDIIKNFHNNELSLFILLVIHQYYAREQPSGPYEINCDNVNIRLILLFIYYAKNNHHGPLEKFMDYMSLLFDRKRSGDPLYLEQINQLHNDFSDLSKENVYNNILMYYCKHMQNSISWPDLCAGMLSDKNVSISSVTSKYLKYKQKYLNLKKKINN